jgi:hypothetical protein
MQEGRDCVNDVTGALMDGLRKIDEFCYAIMPKDVAHAVGDLNKAVLTQFRNFVDWKIRWNDDRVAGADRMREEWREKCRPEPTVDATTEV